MGENINSFPVFVACKYGNKILTNDCNLFSRTYTTMGIGYTFNAPDFWEMYRNTSTNWSFFKEMHEKIHHGKEARPKMITSSGQDFSLLFYLSHQPYQTTNQYGYRDFFSSYGFFYLGEPNKVLLKIHDPRMIGDLRNSDMELRPGFFYDVSVIPSLIMTDAEGLDLPPLKRNCLEVNEGEPSRVFTNYSQSGCGFECKIRSAVEKYLSKSWSHQ